MHVGGFFYHSKPNITMSSRDSDNEETFRNISGTSISDSDNEVMLKIEFSQDIVKLKPYDFEPLFFSNCQVETAKNCLSLENQDSSFHSRVGNECNEWKAKNDEIECLFLCYVVLKQMKYPGKFYNPVMYTFYCMCTNT